MIPAHIEIGRGSGPRRSRNQVQRPREDTALELTGKELRS